ncbi:MAG: hypothetical protein JWO30_1414 [Fibrobacteres bacterium]|nr:hypothetical protein [Fibrobacterota bacterium]
MGTRRPWQFLLFIFLGACAAGGPVKPAQPRNPSAERAAAMEIVKDSPSDILRAAGILWIQVQQADFGAAQPTPTSSALNVRKATLKLLLKGIFKGKFTEPEGTTVTAQVDQYVSTLSRQFAKPGVWSNLELAVGKEFIVFSKVQGASVLAALADSGCDKILPAEDALADVRLAATIEKGSNNLEQTLRMASAEAPKLSDQFANYLWQRASENCLKNPAAYERMMQFLESPGLTYGMQYTLLGKISSSVEGNPGLPAGYANRLGLALFRMLSHPGEGETKENLIDIFLPNLLGLAGSATPKSASDIFKGHAAEKTKAEDFLAAYKGPKDAKPLLEWIRKP